jgi:(1->4)-alpha-D-glucan 1-alpha-D-glucosylmutase
VRLIVGDEDYPLGRKVWGNDRIYFFNGSPCWWRNAITEQLHKAEGLLYIGDVMQHFPVALLLGKEGR